VPLKSEDSTIGSWICNKKQISLCKTFPLLRKATYKNFSTSTNFQYTPLCESLKLRKSITICFANFLSFHVLEEKLIGAWLCIPIIMNYDNTFRITLLSFTTRTASASSSQFFFFFVVAWHQNTLYFLDDYTQK
jgi:hypothetical protein